MVAETVRISGKVSDWDRVYPEQECILDFKGTANGTCQAFYAYGDFRSEQPTSNWSDRYQFASGATQVVTASGVNDVLGLVFELKMEIGELTERASTLT